MPPAAGKQQAASSSWPTAGQQQAASSSGLAVGIRRPSAGCQQQPASNRLLSAAGQLQAGSRPTAAGQQQSNRTLPATAGQMQLLLLRRRFPERWANGMPSLDLPLFPSEQGRVVSKEAALDTITWAARLLQVPVASADGSEHISGHTLRGRQLLAISMALLGFIQ